MFEGHWSWREVGYSSKTMIQSIPRNQPWSIFKKDGWRLSLQTNYNWETVERSETCRTCEEAEEYFWARVVLPGRMGTKARIERLLAGYRTRLQAVIVAWGGVTKYKLTGLPNFLTRAFFLFFKFYNLKKCVMFNAAPFRGQVCFCSLRYEL